MIAVKELKSWLKTLEPDDSVGIDERGLSLFSAGDPEAYLEVGGDPEECDDANT
jgi:hypothetical protein